MTTYPYSTARLARPNAPQIKPRKPNNESNRMNAIQRRLQQNSGSAKKVRPGSVARPY